VGLRVDEGDGERAHQEQHESAVDHGGPVAARFGLGLRNRWGMVRQPGEGDDAERHGGRRVEQEHELEGMVRQEARGGPAHGASSSSFNANS